MVMGYDHHLLLLRIRQPWNINRSLGLDLISNWNILCTHFMYICAELNEVKNRRIKFKFSGFIMRTEESWFENLCLSCWLVFSLGRNVFLSPPYLHITRFILSLLPAEYNLVIWCRTPFCKSMQSKVSTGFKVDMRQIFSVSITHELCFRKHYTRNVHKCCVTRVC
jgi:hypothetical protein